MSLIQIDYRVDTSTLGIGGTFDQPSGTPSYPKARVYQDHHPIANAPQDANIPVNAPRNSRVVITVSDLKGRPNVQMAPVRLLAGRWNHEVITVDQMLDASTKPIDEPQFDVNHDWFYSLSYVPGSPAWEQTDQPPFTHFMHGVEIGNATSVDPNAAFGPFVTFNAQSIPGLLWYGLEFSVLEGDVDFGYYWFDPYIRIT